MLVNDMRTWDDADTYDHFIVIVLFSCTKHNVPYKIVKIKRDEVEQRLWGKRSITTVTLPDKKTDRICNSFMVKKNQLLVVANQNMTLVDFKKMQLRHGSV